MTGGRACCLILVVDFGGTSEKAARRASATTTVLAVPVFAGVRYAQRGRKARPAPGTRKEKGLVFRRSSFAARRTASGTGRIPSPAWTSIPLVGGAGGRAVDGVGARRVVQHAPIYPQRRMLRGYSTSRAVSLSSARRCTASFQIDRYLAQASMPRSFALRSGRSSFQGAYIFWMVHGMVRT